MNGTGLSGVERETIVLFNEAESTASVYTFNAALQRQLLEQQRLHPEQVTVTYQGSHGAVDFQIPKKWVKIVPPRVLSPAQREVIDRMNARKRMQAEPGA